MKPGNPQFWSSQVQLEEDLLADSLKKEIVRRVERDAMEAREEALMDAGWFGDDSGEYSIGWFMAMNDGLW